MVSTTYHYNKDYNKDYENQLHLVKNYNSENPIIPDEVYDSVLTEEEKFVLHGFEFECVLHDTWSPSFVYKPIVSEKDNFDDSQ